MTPRSRLAFVALASALAAVPLAAARAFQSKSEPSKNEQPKVDVKAVLKLATAYVDTFQPKLTDALFAEDYIQQVRVNDREPVQRLMSGDFFLTYLPADRNWVAVHDIAEVDGQPVNDRETLQSVLAKGPIERIGQQIANHNARYNIGNITRNFNEPTLPLLILGPKYRENFEFSLSSVKDDPNGVRLATIHYQEKDARGRYTFIGGPQGQHYPSSGDFDVEVETGNIHRTKLTLNRDGVSVTLTTIYGWEPRVELWLPTSFLERYEITINGTHEVDTCVSRYRFQQFTTSGHIKIDGAAGAGS